VPHTQNIKILQFLAAAVHRIHSFQHALARKSIRVDRPHHATPVASIRRRVARTGSILADGGSGSSGHQGAGGGEGARGGAAAARAAVVVDEATVGGGVELFDQLILLSIERPVE